MYEIYINDRPLRLCSSLASSDSQGLPETHLFARYSGKVKTLLHYADLLEKGSPKVTAVTLYHPQLAKLWTDFKSHYKIVPAAGGLVNRLGSEEYLFIYRLGYLDLPKGKIDPGETIQGAAVREVMEETGLHAVQLSAYTQNEVDPLLTEVGYEDELIIPRVTLHTYRNKKGKRILKPTYWFAMQATQAKLLPQKEEGIEWAKWLTVEEALATKLPYYASLGSVFRSA